MDFATRLETLLKDKSLTKKELAELIEIRRPLISEWKKKKSFPYADIAVKISKTLGVTVEYLITGNDDQKPDERELLAIYRRLNKTGQEAAIGAVAGLVSRFPQISGQAGESSKMAT